MLRRTTYHIHNELAFKGPRPIIHFCYNAAGKPVKSIIRIVVVYNLLQEQNGGEQPSDHSLILTARASPVGVPRDNEMGKSI